MKRILILTLMIGLFSSCLEKLDPNKLAGTQWQLSNLKGSILPTGAKATLNIEKDLKINGKSFCNNYGGKIDITDDKIALKNIFGTKMFCNETDMAERAYLNALNQINQARLVNGKLQLLKDEDVLLVFTKLN